VYDNCTDGDLFRCAHDAHQRIVEQCCADSLVLLADIDS